MLLQASIFLQWFCYIVSVGAECFYEGLFVSRF